MIDTHAHLNFPDYEGKIDEIIQNAIKNKIDRIICVSSNLADSKKSIKIAKKYPGIVYPSVGIHPHNTDPENNLSSEEQIAILHQLAKESKVVAIGECGLDFSPAPPKEKNRSFKEQIFLFKKQIEIAQELALPIIVHSRKAFPKTIAVLNSYKNLTGVFHCYSAGKKRLKDVLRLGFYFGVDGNLTYDTGLQNIFKQIPIEKNLLETDAPFLTPTPYRGQPNQPAFLIYIAKKLAKIKNFTLNKIDRETSKNAINLFQL